MPVGDCCQHPVARIGPQESLRAAARRMEDEGVGSLVVVEGERVVGIVTDRDLVLKGIRGGLDFDATPVRRLLQGDPVVVHADSPLAIAAGVMRRRALRRLPVVDRQERLVGIVTADDLLRLVARELSGLAEAAAAQAPLPGRGAVEAEVGPEVE